jgi:hypothetical protein
MAPLVFNPKGKKGEFAIISNFEDFEREDRLTGFAISRLDMAIILSENWNIMSRSFSLQTRCWCALPAGGTIFPAGNFALAVGHKSLQSFDCLNSQRAMGRLTPVKIKERDESLKSSQQGGAWKLVLRVMKDIFHELALSCSHRSGGVAALKETGSMT